MKYSSTEILETLSFFDSWEERYKYIIDLGKDLPPMDAAKKTDENIVLGCQSKVWLTAQEEDGVVRLSADSDAFIVKGLLAVVLAAFDNKTREEINEFDIETYLSEMQLMKHLSSTRGNGVRAVVDRIQQYAQD